MRKESIGLYVVRLALTLLAITALVAAALSAVNTITAPVIVNLNQQKTQAAIAQVLPGGGELLPGFTDETGTVQAVYASETGYAVQVAPNGFNGAIVMMVGIDPEGNVLGIDVISNTETAGLGAIAGADSAKGQAFREQFVGASGELAVKNDGGVIDSITSATISSRAVVAGVNAALACVENLG